MQIDERDAISLSSLVNQWIEAFNRHDVAGLVALYTDDAELFDPGMKRPRHGRYEIETWFKLRFRTMPSITYKSVGLLFTHKQVAVCWTSYGRTPRLLSQSWLSRPFQIDGVSVFTTQDGLIVKQRGFYDHLYIVERILPPLKWLLPARL